MSAASCRRTAAPVRASSPLIAEEPHRSFGADLVGQTYQAELGGLADPAGLPRGRT